MTITIAAREPLLRYPGAKWAIAPWIIGHMPPHVHYLDLFCGSGAVFFTKPPAKHEVINDLNGDVVNAFRVIREQGAALAAAVAMTPWAREEERNSHEPCDEPLERARRFFVRYWQGHKQGGWITTGKREPGIAGGGRFYPADWTKIPERILACVERLRMAEIEQRDARDLIPRYAAADVLLYADPPYLLDTRSGGQRLYADEMGDEASHAALLDLLDAHPGPVILSGYRHPLYDARLAAWTCKTKDAQGEQGQAKTEALWLNPACTKAVDLGPLFAKDRP